MSYGYVYVASVSMGASYNQLLRAMREAESYDGPSLIIAYSPCIEHGIDMSMSVEESKKKLWSAATGTCIGLIPGLRRKVRIPLALILRNRTTRNSGPTSPIRGAMPVWPGSSRIRRKIFTVKQKRMSAAATRPIKEWPATTSRESVQQQRAPPDRLVRGSFLSKNMIGDALFDRSAPDPTSGRYLSGVPKKTERLQWGGQPLLKPPVPPGRLSCPACYELSCLPQPEIGSAEK